MPQSLRKVKERRNLEVELVLHSDSFESIIIRHCWIYELYRKINGQEMITSILMKLRHFHTTFFIR